MADARIEKLARVMVNYSLELKPGQKFWLRTTPLAEELNLAVYEEAVKAGAHVFVDQRMPGAEEIFYKYASDEQLDYISPCARSWSRRSTPSYILMQNITAATSLRSMAPASPAPEKPVQDYLVKR